MTLLALAILFLATVLMHIFKVRLFYYGTDKDEYERSLFGVLIVDPEKKN